MVAKQDADEAVGPRGAIVAYLRANPNGATMSELREALTLSPAQVALALRQLDDAGMVWIAHGERPLSKYGGRPSQVWRLLS